MAHSAQISEDSGYAPKGFFIYTKHPCQNVASMKMTKEIIGDSEFIEPMTERIAYDICDAYNETIANGIEPSSIPEMVKLLQKFDTDPEVYNLLKKIGQSK
jgi:hypothetical protein